VSLPRLRLEKCRKDGGVWLIDEEQAHHLSHVRRCATGDFAEGLLDGVKIKLRLRFTADATSAEEVSRCEEVSPAAEIELLLALLKAEQFDEALRFAAETGVSRIRLLACERSVPKYEGARLAEKMSRWRRVLDESTKQAGAARAPLLCEPVKPSELDITSLPQTKLSAMFSQIAVNIRDVEFDESVAVAIGPEGDWSPDESRFFLENGFTPITLGRRILRASTAVAVACGVLSLANDAD
jgi:16S rRNA (uracil1498-N3)-methyltransferase